MPYVKFLKRIVVCLLILLLTTALFTGGCGEQKNTSNSKNTQTFELKLAHFWPSTHKVETKLVTEWAKKIERVTDGQVKITSYPGGTLLESAEIYDGVVNGVADIGISCYAYNRGRFPVMETFLLPGISYNNSIVASKSAWEGAKAINPQELQDTKHLMIFATGPGDLMMKETASNLEDLQGVEIGATGGPRADGLELLGATPVIMPMPECYEAQSRGVIKGVLGPLEVLKGFKIGEVTNCVIKTPFLYNQLFYMTMNQDKWDSLPPGIQETITEVTNKYYEEEVIGLWDEINKTGLEWTKEQKKLEIVTLSEEQQKEWQDRLNPVIEEHISMLNEKGLEGEKIVSTVQEIIDEYNQKYE